ncbi:SCO-spondin-like [Montipora foliosa]|uniref:SCO-spondin-like n=1 Tax=Montipora foliosa TaxID=591990 RepID=UPI0035F0FAF9
MLTQVMSSRIVWTLLFLLGAFSTRGAEKLEKCPRVCQCTATNMVYMYCGSEDGLSVFPSFVPPQVEILSLHTNRLRTIPEEALRNLTHLATLNLRSNQLRDLPPTVLRDLVRLRSLNVGFNKLSMLPGCLFEGLHNLQEIYLNNNELENIPEELFQNLPSLKRLHLHFNRLKSLPGNAFLGTFSMQGLSLASNFLTGIHVETFSNLSSLRRLNLAGNRITNIPVNVFRRLSSLAILELENNYISTIQDGAFTGLRAGIVVYLNGNPFYCNCQLRWLKNWITTMTKHLHTSRVRTTCSQPEHVKGKPLIYVAYDQFVCVAGKWTEWSPWSACSSTCGSGTQESRRDCTTNQTLAKGGKECKGERVRTQSCRGNECGTRWTTWSEWSHCTRTCSSGIELRMRFCKSTATEASNNSCRGVSQETRICIRQPCTVDGAWGSWSPWAPCSVTCAWGNRVRTRNCNNPRPQYGGQPCPETDRSIVSQICYLGSCPVHGGWSLWSPWSPCNSSCGKGTRTRHRICNSPAPHYGGNMCNGTSTQWEYCTLKECPIDGEWTFWSPWSHCSRTCSVGSQLRIRSCSNPSPQHGGQSCPGISSEFGYCNFGPCPVHGAWGAWSPWSDCSKTCGKGSRFRNRTCSNPQPIHGGRDCPGNSHENSQCDFGPCPIHGHWTAWSSWSDCSKTCASGTRSRSRSCSNPVPQHGGQNCSGNYSEDWHCDFGPCPIHGQWTTWSMWSECSATCANGSKFRHRTCNSPLPKFGGRNCSGEGKEMKPCTLASCPVHGEWSAWSQWSECDKSCSSGVKFRTRTCSNPFPSSGGTLCTGNSTELEMCQQKPCAIHGRWSEWSDWTDCMKTCGNGTKSRYRSCDNPSPEHGGKNCSGDALQSKQCFQQSCPAVGKWTEWSRWSACSKTCAVGQQTRTRSCIDSNCKSVESKSIVYTSNKTEIRACYRGPCPEPGIENEWTPWSQCSRSCGLGNQQRFRKCNLGEGAYCVGSNLQVKACYLRYCKVNGGWSSWSIWTECSSSCGTGVQAKMRLCNHPKPQGGGDRCHGKAVIVKRCTASICFPDNYQNDSFWSSWTSWSRCSVTCSRGYRTRSRYCRKRMNPFQLGNCSEATGPVQVESSICEMQPCASWSRWSSWGVCSQSCAGGIRKRFRVCKSNATELKCQGGNSQGVKCNTISCPPVIPLVKYPPKINLVSPNSCPDPDKPLNGYYKITNQGGSYFTTYYCNRNYNVHGPRLRHCESDGTWSDYVPYCLPVCGESSLTHMNVRHQRLRIFGGTESARGLWPWQVVLTINGIFQCGGSLISEDWIVTAAHCVYKRLTKKHLAGIRIHLGVHDISSSLEDHNIQRIDSLDIVPHPDFNWRTFDSDLALIQLKRKVNVTDYVRPVCLPNKQQRRKVIPGAMGVMLGWGFTETDSPSSKLRQVYMPVVKHSSCQKAYEKESWPVTANMICAGYARRARDSCKQDSGGGFIFPDSRNKKKKWFLGGIISWGNPRCGTPGKYSVLTHINSKFTRWIKNYIYN